MQGRVRVVCIGFDAHRAYPIRLGAARAQQLFGLEVDLEVLDREEAGTLDPESAAQLAQSADAVFVAGLTEERFLPAARALAGSAPRFYPSAPNLFEISAMARVPGLALDDPGAAGALAAAAAACAAAGKPVPPVPGLVATVLPQAAHLVAEDQPDLRRLGRVLQALLNLSPENAALAFAAVAHEAQPGQIPDPGWPEIYPACGFWHPDAGVFARWTEFEAELERRWRGRERVGRALVVVFSTQVTGGNDAHLRSLIAALERRGIEAVPWFGALDAAGEVGEVLKVPAIDLVINASGFTLTGTHGQPNIAGDVELLRRWDVPHLNAVPLLFQSLEQWDREPLGLLPIAVAMQVAVPELEAALAPRVFAGRAADDDRMASTAQADRVAAHAARLIQLRTKPNREKRVAIVLFCVPPDAGAVGTAAYLDVFASLHALLARLREEGYKVDVPADAGELLNLLVDDSAGGARTGVRIAARYPARRYVETAPGLERVTRCWGEAPGDIDTDGRDLLIRGAVLGNVAVVIQPDNGGYSDPIGLLYRDDASPSHSFTACYDWIRNEFGADVVLHFGTHGALEFMPGKQAGLLPTDFPDALIGDLPHVYYYCMNNPAEAAIARRRSASEIVSYLSPPVEASGLYGALEAARAAAVALRDDPGNPARAAELRQAAAAAGLDAVADPSDCEAEPLAYLERVTRALDDLERTLIPLGLHVLGRGIDPDEARGILAAACEYPLPDQGGLSLVDELTAVLGSEEEARKAARIFADAVAAGAGKPAAPPFTALPEGTLERWHRALTERLRLLDATAELDGLVAALSGRYIPPSPGGDPVREPDALPTGRGLVALDPYRVPTATAARAGERLAEQLLEAAAATDGRLPETVGVVVWGLETIKARGEAIAQVLWLIGVRPEPDAFGRMTRFRIVPIEELGRPRVDVVVTVSGIFRDLFLPATELLDRAFRAVAALEEPPELNYVRKHALELAKALDIDPGEAAARVFSQRAGRYGTGVNDLVLSSEWEGNDDLANAFQHAMAFAYGERRTSVSAPAVFHGLLRTVEATFQNIDSTEVSLSDVDHYFEYLGGLSNAVRAARGTEPATYVADTFRPGGRVRSLAEALWIETRSRLLNPKWRDAMLEHGYNGVAQVAMRLDNTYGWAATTSAVDGRLLEDVAREYLLNDALRERMAAENPLAVKRMADRLVEAAERGLWEAPSGLVESLRDVAGRLNDAVEGAVLYAG